MSYAPLTKNTKTYKGSTYDFSITVKEDGVDLDLSQLDKVQVIMKNQGQTVFDYNNTDEGSLSLSGDNNETVSGTVSADTMDLPVQRRFYQELRLYFSDGSEDVYFVLTHEIIDETSGVSQGAHDYEIDIDTDAEQVTGGAASSLARTIEARDEAEGFAANLDRADIESGDAGKIERIKSDESGWFNTDREYQTISDTLGVDASEFTDGHSSNLLGFYSQGDGGGSGIFYDPDRSKSDHNGGTVWNPDHNSPPGSANWYSAAGDSTDTSGTGCWVRKNKNTGSLFDFGTKGDGVNDDYYAFQNALNALNEVLIYNTSDQYVLGSQVTIPSNTKITGIGKPKIKKGFDATGNDSWLFRSDTKSDITIQNIEIDFIPSSYNDIEQLRGMEFVDSSNIDIFNVTIEKGYLNSITLRSCSNSNVLFCEIHGLDNLADGASKVAIYAPSGSNNNFGYNYIDYFKGGIYNTGSVDGIVGHNIMKNMMSPSGDNNSLGCIEFYGNCNNFIVESNNVTVTSTHGQILSCYRVKNSKNIKSSDNIWRQESTNSNDHYAVKLQCDDTASDGIFNVQINNDTIHSVHGGIIIRMLATDNGDIEDVFIENCKFFGDPNRTGGSAQMIGTSVSGNGKLNNFFVEYNKSKYGAINPSAVTDISVRYNSVITDETTSLFLRGCDNLEVAFNGIVHISTGDRGIDIDSANEVYSHHNRFKNVSQRYRIIDTTNYDILYHADTVFGKKGQNSGILTGTTTEFGDLNVDPDLYADPAYVNAIINGDDPYDIVVKSKSSSLIVFGIKDSSDGSAITDTQISIFWEAKV